MATQKKFVVKNGLIASGLTYPTADGTAGQSIVTDAAGNLSFGTSSAAETLTFPVRNNSGSTLVKGTAVYVSGLNGNTPEVSPARANSSSTMPAFGLVTADILDTEDGTVATFGSLKTLNVSNFGETGITFALGDTVYISASEAGKLTNVAPTSESNFIQNIGRIERATPTSNMTIKVGGAGRTNATPALNDGNIFIGDSNNAATTITLNTTNVPEASNLYYTTTRADSDFDIRLATKDTGDLSEGSNLYYTTPRADSDFDNRLAIKDTDDLSEGASNLYHTPTRVNSLIDTRVSKSFVDALNVDADTLDGLNSTQFLRSDVDDTHLGNLTIDSDVTVGGILYGPSTFYIDPAPVDSDAGTLVIRGNLQVQGTQTTINSATVSINDLNLVLADSAANAAAADGAGITINGAAATLTYAATGDKFVFNKAPYLNTDRILTAADIGTGNGLDADTVDGQHYDDIISEATALAIALG